MTQPNEDKRNILTNISEEGLKELQEKYPEKIVVFNEEKSMEERFDALKKLRIAIEDVIYEMAANTQKYIPSARLRVVKDNLSEQFNMALKAFIHSENQRLLEKIEGEVECEKKISLSTNLDGVDTEDYELIMREKRYRDTYNQALSDALDIIRKYKNLSAKK
jgi:predicted AAA+ superfamily ATPase